MVLRLPLPVFCLLLLPAISGFLLPVQKQLTAAQGRTRVTSSTSDDDVTTDWRKDFA